MSSMLTRAIILSCGSGLSACATQGYSGPARPAEQTATISLAAPTLSLLPPFWVFPLNLLPRLDQEWRDTVDYRITVDDRELTRFDALSLLPGRHSAAADYSWQDTKLIGGQTCTSSTSHYDYYSDHGSCTITTTCQGLFKITEREQVCRLDFTVDTGGDYQLFLDNREENLSLTLRNAHDAHIEKRQTCQWTPPRSHQKVLTDTSTTRCAPPVPEKHPPIQQSLDVPHPHDERPPRNEHREHPHPGGTRKDPDHRHDQKPHPADHTGTPKPRHPDNACPDTGNIGEPQRGASDSEPPCRRHQDEHSQTETMPQSTEATTRRPGEKRRRPDPNLPISQSDITVPASPAIQTPATADDGANSSSPGLDATTARKDSQTSPTPSSSGPVALPPDTAPRPPSASTVPAASRTTKPGDDDKRPRTDSPPALGNAPSRYEPQPVPEAAGKLSGAAASATPPHPAGDKPFAATNPAESGQTSTPSPDKTEQTRPSKPASIVTDNPPTTIKADKPVSIIDSNASSLAPPSAKPPSTPSSETAPLNSFGHSSASPTDTPATPAVKADTPAATSAPISEPSRPSVSVPASSSATPSSSSPAPSPMPSYSPSPAPPPVGTVSPPSASAASSGSSAAASSSSGSGSASSSSKSSADSSPKPETSTPPATLSPPPPPPAPAPAPVTTPTPAASP